MVDTPADKDMYESYSYFKKVGTATPDIELKSTESKLSGLSDASSEHICKICHCGVSESPLISPCRCKGSMRYTHPKCIMKWLNYSQHRKCELCKTKFNLKKVGYNSCREWKMVEVDCDSVLHLLLFGCSLLIFLISLIGWRYIFDESSDGCSKSFNEKSMRMILYITYGPLNVLQLILAALEIKLVLIPIITQWQQLNENIIVLPYEEKWNIDLDSKESSFQYSRPI